LRGKPVSNFRALKHVTAFLSPPKAKAWACCLSDQKQRSNLPQRISAAYRAGKEPQPHGESDPLKESDLQAQELDLLGRMSRGMAHDLNNLLTPVWTLLQLANESGANTLDDELLPVALRNIKTMRAYIREALFFSENLRPDFQLGRLDMLVRQAGELAKTSRKKRVDVRAGTPEEVLAEVDEVLLQRMIANLVANAIDASPEGAEIDIELTRLEKTDASRDWVRVRIIDRGEGSRKKISTASSHPTLRRRIVATRIAALAWDWRSAARSCIFMAVIFPLPSQVKKGTTVQVDLPTRQTKSDPAVLTAPV
jgi:signal transduction histidine kinase